MDLNADLGEGFPWDEPLLERVTSASVSCGVHAGDPSSIARTLRWAKLRRVVVGAHPGFDDREGFGRREQALDRGQAERLILDQVAALRRMADPEGVAIRFVKPHGALYNQARHDPELALGIVSAMATLGLPVLGQPGGELERLARIHAIPFVGEGFADRAYDALGGLVPRGQPGAILHDPAAIADQVVSLARRGLATLCLHGDDPRCVELADLARSALERHGVRVEGFLPWGS